jgi:hypothetical protein
MVVRHWVIVLVIAAAMSLVACTASPAAAPGDEPATVEEIPGSELSRITLSTKAVERLGIETAPVGGAGTQLTIPYAAVLYDSEGKTWTYATPDENVFVRHEIVVDRVDGDVAYVADGPPVGTEVVTTGAAELFGTETGVGGGH